MTTYDANQAPEQGADIATHQFSITIFPDNYAKRKTEHRLTLVELHALITNTTAARKQRLPLLKLMTFGDVVTIKKCLRHNDNITNILGVEVEHDAGTMSFEDAVDRLRKAKIRAVIYTTPSHSSASPRWRVLAPFWETTTHRSVRKAMAERLNAVLGGQLAGESFVGAQAFYFGRVKGSETFRANMLEGDFIDLADDIEAMTSTAKRKGAPHVTVFADQTIAQLIEHLTRWCANNELPWHDPMLHLTAKLAASGMGLEEIIERCAPFCWGGEDDRDVHGMADGAVRKFGRSRSVEQITKELGEMFAQASAESEEAGGTRVVPPAADAPAQPGVDASLFDKAAWLTQCFGFYQQEDRVIDLFEPSNDCRIRLGAFRTNYAHWFEVETGPRGGERRTQAVALWQTSASRIAVRGVRMAPDRPFPVYEEHGSFWKNVYRRPCHAVVEGASAAVFLEFIEHLIPDAGERSWFLKSMAHKWRYPEDPGSAVMFVAPDTFGCGRGVLFSIARRLYGERYVREQEFGHIVGTKDGARFNSWMADCVLAVCNEARTSATAYRRGERRAEYESFKSFFDPASRTRTVEGKGINSYESAVYMSLWMATNHADAFVIDADDRRLTCISNGPPLADDLRDRILAWRKAAGSMAALAAALEAIDLTGFDAQKALATPAKAAMIEGGKTGVDDLMEDMAEDDEMGLVFTRSDLFEAVCGRGGEGNSVGYFEAGWRDYVVPVRGPKEQCKLRIDGKKVKLFCFKRRAAEAEKLPEHRRRVEREKYLGLKRR